MAHVLLRRQAIELRKLGKSYNQIKQLLGIPKSTLSDWLKSFPLTAEQINALKGNIAYRIEKYREARRIKREAKLQTYYNEEKIKLLPLSKRELFIAGIFLYWGEGTKTANGQVVIANTDPSLVQFAVLWLTKALGIPKTKLNILVHLYKDMEIEESLNYWSNLLGIPRNQFAKSYIKESKRSDIDYKGYGHGTCNLRVYNNELKQRILLGIKAVGDYSRDVSTQSLL